MATWPRATALMSMSSPPGTDQLIPISLDANEQISQPFSSDVRAVSQRGIVQAISAEGEVRGQGLGQYQGYHIVLVPRLWFLSQTTACRVYQKLTVVGILEQLFDAANLTDRQLPPPSAEREYTGQFNETDLSFASSLMEEEGYFYFFQHTAVGHTLIVANQNSAFTDIDGATMHLSGGESEATWLTDWSRPTGTVSGKMTFKDYDPTKPDTLLQAEHPTTLQTAGAPQRDVGRRCHATPEPSPIARTAKWKRPRPRLPSMMGRATTASSSLAGNSRSRPRRPRGRTTTPTCCAASRTRCATLPGSITPRRRAAATASPVSPPR